MLFHICKLTFPKLEAERVLRVTEVPKVRTSRLCCPRYSLDLFEVLHPGAVAGRLVGGSTADSASEVRVGAFCLFHWHGS